MHSAVHDTIAAVWRIESARIVAAVARRVRDLGVAEELAQDALVAALEHWPKDGVPDNPGAWLMTTAKNRALDALRHRQMADARHEDIARDLEALGALTVPDFVDALDAARQDDIGDDLLRLIFTACHPVLSTDARVALTLKLLGGLTTGEIARAYLVPEATLVVCRIEAVSSWPVVALTSAVMIWTGEMVLKPRRLIREPVTVMDSSSVAGAAFSAACSSFSGSEGGSWARTAGP